MNLPFVVGISPTLHIRGLIATEDIKNGSIIETCPLIFVSIKSEEEFLKNTVMWKYYFEWTKNITLLCGIWKFINNSLNQMPILFSFKEQTMVYRAIRKIKKGEELTINYNWDPKNQDPVDAHLMDFNAHITSK
jgi:hypothetical protein